MCKYTAIFNANLFKFAVRPNLISMHPHFLIVTYILESINILKVGILLNLTIFKP